MTMSEIGLFGHYLHSHLERRLPKTKLPSQSDLQRRAASRWLCPQISSFTSFYAPQLVPPGTAEARTS